MTDRNRTITVSVRIDDEGISGEGAERIPAPIAEDEDWQAIADQEVRAVRDAASAAHLLALAQVAEEWREAERRAEAQLAREFGRVVLGRVEA